MATSYTHLDQFLNVLKPFVLIENQGRVSIFQGSLRDLRDTDEILELSKRYDSDIVFFSPFRTHGHEPILSMSVDAERSAVDRFSSAYFLRKLA
jgi:hypothetical protein